RSLGQLYSEMSPIRAYRDIREHPNEFDYQFGRTIVPPLASKLIPRSWLPDKPTSSSAYYNQIRTPEAFAAGYAVPLTIFGDALINFGYACALAVAVLLGIVASRIEYGLLVSSTRWLPAFMVIFYG